MYGAEVESKQIEKKNTSFWGRLIWEVFCCGNSFVPTITPHLVTPSTVYCRLWSAVSSVCTCVRVYQQGSEVCTYRSVHTGVHVHQQRRGVYVQKCTLKGTSVPSRRRGVYIQCIYRGTLH